MSTKGIIIRNLILLCIAIFGMFLGGYLGGLISGACFALMIVFTIGRFVVTKTINRFDNTYKNFYNEE